MVTQTVKAVFKRGAEANRVNHGEDEVIQRKSDVQE